MQALRKIVIVGGGSSGWMTAALLSKLFQGLYEITLIESAEIATIGVGEATIPPIKTFNTLLGLDENAFMAATQASFKMGIRFVDWWQKGHSYLHGFGKIGQEWEWLSCHQYWLAAQARGAAGDFADYAITAAAARTNRFMRAQPQLPESPLGQIAHAFHFDAALYARFLAGFAEARGVRRREGRVVDVGLRGEDGFIDHLIMDDGEVISGDLFIDCSGFRALLIEGALATGFEDWSHWLPCDRALAVPCRRSANFTPYTTATAQDAGWQWRIPLQHRTGNGHVYASRFTDDETAARVLLANLDGEPLADPLPVRFVAGKRRQLWAKNCVAIGLAGGFLEPLESTSLHLVQSGIIRLVKLLPDASFNPANIAEFNRQSDFEYERIRDFIILHYKATARNDTPFWDYCRQMDIPETLRAKIAVWMANGRIFREDEELFAPESWIQVMLGQGQIPHAHDPLVHVKSDAEIDGFLGNVREVIAKCVAVMPAHADYVAQHCQAPAPPGAAS